jgi:uncharacterized protein DUF3105
MVYGVYPVGVRQVAILPGSMAHRQEEKEKRRLERLEREEAERKAAARRKRLQYVFGGLLAVAAVAGIVAVLALGVLGSDDGGGPGNPTSASDAASSVKLPAPKTGDLKVAAKAAGCELSNPAIEGSTHEDKTFKASDYKTNPPTSGNHNPDWYEDGIYSPGDTPRLGMLVHTLEHGRIDVQYKEGTSPDDVAKLEAFLGETDGYHMLLFQNTTGMDAAVAATAWGHSLTCPKLDDTTWDALRTFRTSYIDKGPESVP